MPVLSFVGQPWSPIYQASPKQECERKEGERVEDKRAKESWNGKEKHGVEGGKAAIISGTLAVEKAIIPVSLR